MPKYKTQIVELTIFMELSHKPVRILRGYSDELSKMARYYQPTMQSWIRLERLINSHKELLNIDFMEDKIQLTNEKEVEIKPTIKIMEDTEYASILVGGKAHEIPF